MKLKFVIIRRFDEDPKPINSVEVAKDAKFVDCSLSIEGIVAWFETPTPSELVVVETKWEKFKILEKDDEIPEGAKFIKILDFIAGDEEDQKFIALPIYKL